MVINEILYWVTILFTAGMCFTAGWVAGINRERREMRKEQSRLKQILAAQEPRNGQRASHRAPSARAKISSADMSRSRTPFQSKLSREKGQKRA